MKKKLIFEISSFLTTLKGSTAQYSKNPLFYPKFGFSQNFTEGSQGVHGGLKTCLGCPKTLWKLSTVISPTLTHFGEKSIFSFFENFFGLKWSFLHCFWRKAHHMRSKNVFFKKSRCRIKNRASRGVYNMLWHYARERGCPKSMIWKTS